MTQLDRFSAPSPRFGHRMARRWCPVGPVTEAILALLCALGAATMLWLFFGWLVRPASVYNLWTVIPGGGRRHAGGRPPAAGLAAPGGPVPGGGGDLGRGPHPGGPGAGPAFGPPVELGHLLPQGDAGGVAGAVRERDLEMSGASGRPRPTGIRTHGRGNSLSPLSRCARQLPLIRGVVPSPTGFKKICRNRVGEPLGAPAVNGLGTVGSANPGAVVKPHRPQFSAKPGPQWGRDEFRHPLKFCAPEGFCLPQGVTPVMGSGERRL